MYTIKRPWFLLTVPFLALAGVHLATAQTTTVTMGAYPSGVEGPVMGGVYTSPYYATLGSSTSTVPIICDDFVDDTYFSESWTAYSTSLSSVDGSSAPPGTLTAPYGTDLTGTQNSPGVPEFAGGYAGEGVPAATITALTQEQAYTVAAYLAVEILRTNESTLAGQQMAGDLSYAMWALFDPAVIMDNGASCSLSYGCLSSTDLTNAENDLNNAWLAVKNGGITTSNFDTKLGVESATILTYDSSAGPPTGCGGTCPPPPQEFISINMPEPSTLSLLGIDLLGVAGLVLFARRRWTGSERP